MSYVQLALAKAHLLVIHDHDDVLIQQNIDAAESAAANYMNRPNIADDPVRAWRRNQPDCVVSSESPDVVPAAVVQAILLMVGDYYENRTQGVVGTIFTLNPSAENLMWPHRINMGI